MANMSYCRNENTFHDLIDCINNIFTIPENERDAAYRKRLIATMIDFVESGAAEEALEVVEEVEEE